MRIDFDVEAEYTSYPGNPGRARGPAEECEEPFGPSADVGKIRIVGARLAGLAAAAEEFLPTLAKLSNIQPEDCAAAILKSL